MADNKRGILVVLSGPSGTGKGTICQMVREHLGDRIGVSISATTRAPRGEETHGKEYFFYTKEEFEDLRDRGGLLEWAQVYDNYYGTPKAYVEQLLADGKDCILEIDPQGAMQIREASDEAVLVYVMPPSMEELRNRLIGRGTETMEQVEKRMSCARDEMAYRDKYDYIIVNDELSQAAAKMEAVMQAEKCRRNRNMEPID